MMKAERYYAIERELRDFRDIVADLLANNPKLPQHITRVLERRLEVAAAAINMPEDLK
jgi:hypothetical protein